VANDNPAAARSRALVEQIPRYLRAMAGRGTPVLAGAMENVPQCRRWDDWSRWVKEIQNAGPGYETRLIALNSAHVLPRNCLPVPQSRNRLYLPTG
jgi:DNA (cytosine-5)-methyltransferase 1